VRCLRFAAWDIGDGWVQLEVTDSGRGVPEDLQSRIFEPFFTTKPSNKGLGLGLSICLNVMRGLGGGISLARRATGTTFVLTFRSATVPGETVAADGCAGDCSADTSTARSMAIDHPTA
jgi:signal transduction histidine kinase